MAEYWQLDYGYKVRILRGRNKDRKGWVVYGSDLGHICINTHEIPKDNSYTITEFPGNLEVLSTDNPYKIKPLFGRDLSNFDFAKLKFAEENTKEVLMNRKYFDENAVQNAKKRLVMEFVRRS